MSILFKVINFVLFAKKIECINSSILLCELPIKIKKKTETPVISRVYIVRTCNDMALFTDIQTNRSSFLLY